MYDIVLFDLDGTLTDPGIGITNSVMHALKHFGITVNDRSELYKFIGPPLLDAFSSYFGFTKEQSEEALRVYREYFSVNGLFENEIYDGIIPLLDNLKKRNKKILLATAKPELYATKILKHFDIFDYFDFVAGASMDESRNKKEDVILYAIENFGIKDTSKCIMIGDREHDILGAKKFSMDSIGVLYGYGSREELTDAGASFIVENVCDIIKFI